MIIEGPIGAGTIYPAVYRRADAYCRLNGGTFADIESTTDYDWRLGLTVATEKVSDDGTPTGLYSWEPELDPGVYSIAVFTEGADVIPDGSKGDPEDRDRYIYNRFVLSVNNAGTMLNLFDVVTENLVYGSVNDGSATDTVFVGTSSPDDLSSTDDFYNGAVLVFTTGALKGIARRISDYVGSSKTITVSPAFPTAPANGARFNIVGRIN